MILADASEFPSIGHIENSLNQVDPKTATFELQARFPNPRHTLLPGQFGRVRVQVAARKSAILIPQKAVQQLQSVQTVYTVGPDDKIETKTVTTGERSGNLDYRTGLAAGRSRGGRRPAEGKTGEHGPDAAVSRPESVPAASRRTGN